jgi:hypothetical protein
MNSLTFIPIGSFEKLLEFSFNLEFLYLNESGAFNPKNNMVIFDSITDLYKMKLDPKNKNHNVALNHQLNQILANLYHLNNKYGIELLLVNELSRNQEGEPVLSGGKVMGYWVAYSLQIRRTPALNKRVALLSLPKRASPLTFELTIAEKGFSPIP